MKNFWKIILIGVSSLIIILFFIFRNHIRLYLCRSYAVSESRLVLDEEINEGNFSVEVYDVSRTFRNKWVARYSYLFNDELMAIYLPLNRYSFQNLVLDPMGKDEFNDKSTLRFNTLFFDSEFTSTSGLIDDEDVIGLKVPKKNRLAIDEQGNLINSSLVQNGQYNDVLQAPFTLSLDQRGKGFRTLHYRQFLAVQNGQLIYISGNGNSLICWRDVQEFMKLKSIEKVVALDGGASLDYYFEGAESTYSFSSIPFRRLWFNLNSPYYIEGKLK